MLTREDIRRTEREMNAIMQRIDETVTRRDQGQKQWDEWHAATHAFHLYENPVSTLWNPDVKAKIRSGDRETIEDALLFLEADPWFFRSGYLKERVLSCLKGAPLREKDCARLRNIIWSVIRGRYRRELRHYCRMALRVWTPQWEAQLRAEVGEREHGKPSNLVFLLEFMDKNRDKLRA